MGIKLYPSHGQLTDDENKRGLWTLYVDFICEKCGKVQSVAMAGGTDGTCIRCGWTPRIFNEVRTK